MNIKSEFIFQIPFIAIVLQVEDILSGLLLIQMTRLSIRLRVCQKLREGYQQTQQDSSFFQNDLLRLLCLQRQLEKHRTIYWVVSSSKQCDHKDAGRRCDSPHTHCDACLFSAVMCRLLKINTRYRVPAPVHTLFLLSPCLCGQMIAFLREGVCCKSTGDII